MSIRIKAIDSVCVNKNDMSTAEQLLLKIRRQIFSNYNGNETSDLSNGLYAL